MITLDSPVATVLGDKKKKRERHRRAARPAHRRRPAAPLPAPLREDRRADQGRRSSSEGEMLTVVGRDRPAARSSTYKDRRTGRPAYRVETVAAHRRPVAADVVLRQVRAHRRVERRAGSRWDAAGSSSARSAASASEWQLTNPQMVLFGAGERGRRGEASWLEDAGRLLPDLPAHQGRRLVGPPARGRVRALGASTTCPTCCRTPCATSTTCSTPRTALELDPRARTTTARSTGAQRRFRFEEALVTQLVLARRRTAVRALGAQAAHRRAGRAARGVRRAAALRAHRRPARDRRRRSRPTSPSRTR